MAWWDDVDLGTPVAGGGKDPETGITWNAAGVPLSGVPSEIMEGLTATELGRTYPGAMSIGDERTAFEDWKARNPHLAGGWGKWDAFALFDQAMRGGPDDPTDLTFDSGGAGGDEGGDEGGEPSDPTDTKEFRTLKGTFLSQLELIGLDNATIQSLWEWVEDRFVADSSFTAGQAVIEMKDQQAFKNRFPGIASMRDEKNADGSPAARRDIPTPGEYLARERAWATHLGKYGMSALGADLNTMVAQSYMKSIGEGEFVERLKAASEMIYEAPEAVKTTFGDWFGNHADAALMAVFLDPSNEVFNDDWVGLKGDVAAAEVGGWSRMRLGLDAPVSQERSRAIAELSPLRDIDIWQGLDRLKAKEDLFVERIGEVDYKMEVEGVAAEFGIDTEALSGVELNELIDRRAARRTSDFSGGGGAMLSGTTTGFGAANA